MQTIQSRYSRTYSKENQEKIILTIFYAAFIAKRSDYKFNNSEV